MLIAKIKKTENQTISNLLNVGEHGFVPSVSVDCVIFGFHENQLKVLLLKHRYREMWALPGGFIFRDEDTDAAAYRVLQERTGLNEIFLTQFHVFGNHERYSPAFHKEDFTKDGIEVDDSHWLLQRFITIGYYALVDFLEVTPAANSISEKCEWWDINNLPTFILDHKHILDTALNALRLQLHYQPIGYNLLPQKFTMPEIQKLYETILDKKLDRRNFQRKILGFDILKKLDEIKTGVPHKSPFLYSFDLEKYNRALNEGLRAGW